MTTDEMDKFSKIMIFGTFLFSLFAAIMSVIADNVSATVFFSALFVLDGYQISQFKYDKDKEKTE